MSFGFNPLVQQGNLNRVATNIVIQAFPTLNVTASYMSKGLAAVTFDGPFVMQHPTATGIVNSPEPFVMGQVVINLLRSQSLANNWIAQVETNSQLGSVVAYSDSNVFSPIELTDCSIIDFDPGAYDGMDPTVKVTIKGTFYINSTLWAGLTGGSVTT